ncbi:MAG: peptide deformylase, partial [Clostridia bacterium]|nr:peptide deformylase [Clostridia bacterium]
MAIRNIVTIDDPVLRKKSRPVVNFDEKLWTLLDDMKETLKKADGAGLAAVQVGILRRAVIVDVGDGKPLELIN